MRILLNRIASYARTDLCCRFVLANKRTFAQNVQKPSTNKAIYAKALVAGFTVGLGYEVFTIYKETDHHKEIQRQKPVVLTELPNFKIIRKITNPTDKSNLEIILFQYQTCPFCSKVRAFLDANSYSYSVVEVDAVLRQDIKWSPYKKVPLILVRNKDSKEYVQLTDSTAIVSILSSFSVDPTKPIIELAEIFPRVSYVNANGKKESDILNKYHVVYGDKVPKNITKDDLL